MANVVVSALATWNGKALKKAKQDVNVFDKQIKKLGRTFGLTFSAAALVSFSKKAIKAFTDDEAAAKRLQLQLENTGNAFRVTEVEAYIKSLEKTLGILDDLRAPFQTFLNATGSVELAQRSLEAALDISAGTGQSLSTVVSAISAGIRGQTKAIKGLNTGIDESIIATGDMNKIMAALEKRFSGQSAARLNTYAGKMDVLKKGVDEATKAIGTGLVDALVILSKDESVASLADDFENLGDNIAYAVVEMARLIKKFDDFVDNPQFQAGLLALAILSRRSKAVVAAMGIIGLNAAGNALTQPRSTTQPNVGGYSGIPDLKVAKQLLKARKREYDLINQKNNLEAKNVEELKKKFDLERIGLTQALNVATDEETKLRLRAQLAILDNNDALARKILAEMDAAKAAENLKSVFDSTSAGFISAMARYNEATDRLLNNILERIRQGGYTPPSTVSMPASIGLPIKLAQIEEFTARVTPRLQESGLLPSSSQPLAPLLSKLDEFTARVAPRIAESNNITLTIDTANTSDRFTQLIAESIQAATKTGLSTSPVGSLP
jgi:hypothetical protein